MPESVTILLVLSALLLLCLAGLAAIADAIGEPESWDARRRNGR